MQTKRQKKSLSVFLCSVLIAVMALFAAGCSDNNTSNTGSETPVSSGTSSVVKTVVGEGQKVFDFAVTNTKGNETVFEVHTDKDTVGDALEELKLISGEQGPYGLYVKTVNGETLDFDKDKMYWSFYVNGKYATSGVDKTKITSGTSYAFKAEK